MRTSFSLNQFGDSRRYAVGLARAFGGSIIFSLPILMTSEMWALGLYIVPARLAVLLILLIPLLVPLSHIIGFESGTRWRDDVLDAFAAVAIGALASVVVLLLFGVIKPGMPLDEVIGKVALQAVPGSIGALLAQSELGNEEQEDDADDPGQSEPQPSYLGEIFIMLVGALFLAFNVAPTEEIVLLAYKMSPWHTLALAIVSLIIMHAFVYTVEFRGQHSAAEDASFFSVFSRFTLVGYAVVLLVSLYILWTFGRTDGSSLDEIISATIVLAFPGSVGAAAARLIL